MRARYQLRLASLQKELQIQNQSLETANVHIQEALQESKGLNRELLDINERLRRSETTQGDFLAKMRHEINTPLSALLGLATQLLQDQLPPEQLASLGRMIQAEAFHLDFQVRNVFAAADLEAGAVTPVITQVDVDSVLLNVIDAFSRRASAKSMEVLLEARPEPGPLLFGTDAGMLRLIAANLLANAIEFGPEGTQVSLRAALEGEVLRLDIQDQGMGIRKEHQALIFDRFRQV
jgi:signal transduction histidine kinase